MGEVVRLAKDGEEQFIVHPYGWEKGTSKKTERSFCAKNYQDCILILLFTYFNH